ncbi:hypothetical protein ASPZODRAFT_63268 [Penicilliopsis zonata CBS 506.65]|uniref:Xylanolytic transcriptional activator regulatory domain-containing protein n=1 Tax=Penicilliopsis zonata CBS 506.65 TaxID=1073090 RepID=A0A1L9SL57_9EURO|nr:hypothetical protein ASPZODRAFT_63268 [Penicilliopsis zonata CBS 506.65]OJJ47814.1 hypothetical protein ASPZODRAFT_63268 [Penicilliopsis zonata CBS 506.65]
MLTGRLKCDRRQPSCGTCARRGLSLSCQYVGSNNQNTTPAPATSHDSASLNIMQERISQLETLVMSLADKRAAQETRERFDIDNADISHTYGRLSLENEETSYVEASHWTAILDGIAELKDHFDHPAERNLPLSAPDRDTPMLLYGKNKHASREEILAAVPPKEDSDRMVKRFAEATYPARALIHLPTFMKQYERFWLNPSETPIMWIGLFFSILCLGDMYLESDARDNLDGLYSPPLFTNTTNKSFLYREKTVQCLVLGKYTKAVPFVIETLGIYLLGESIQCEDTEVGFWVLVGVIVRLAQRQGYHRDASRFFPRISPFHAEMRRRLWAIVSQLDTTISAQCGLPRMLREGQSDTAEPHNLLDEDLDEFMTELPPSRPDTMPTLIGAIVAKCRLVAAFGKIADLNLTTTDSVPYAKIQELDTLLNETYRNIPDWLQVLPMTASPTDSPLMIISSIFMTLNFHKAQCALHRRYLRCTSPDSELHAYSRTTCIDAALTILQCQQTLDRELRPGGYLSTVKMPISSALQTEFLHAATILCLVLDDHLNRNGQGDDDTQELELMNRIVQALDRSYSFWVLSKQSSREARKAAEALRIVLTKAGRMRFADDTAGGLIDDAVIPDFPDLSTAVRPTYTLTSVSKLTD